MRKKYDVFISYDDENQKIVEALSHYLEERHVKCFVTYRDIPRNVDQDSFTMEAIGQSQMMLVVFSGVVKMNESMLHNLEVCTEMGKPVLSYRLMNSALYNQNKDYYMTLNWRVGFPDLDECFDAVFRNIVSLIGVEQVDFEDVMMNGDTNDSDSDFRQDFKVKSKGESEPDFGQELEVEPEGEPEPNFGQELEVETEGEPEPDFGQEPEVETGGEPEPDFGQELEVEPEGEPEPDFGQELEVEPEGEPEPNFGQELEVETEGEPEPDFGQELEVETGGEPDDESEGMLNQLVNSEDIASLFEMVSVKGGTFLMGAQNVSSKKDNFDMMAFSDEEPVHTVKLSDFQISKTVVTQAQWKAVMGDLNVQVRFAGDDLPVDSVSWNVACDFISELNAKTGLNFSFPTEAEWEFAARGGVLGNRYKYSGGNDLDAVAWNVKNSSGTTHSVAQKLPNELGIYDMNGNVWEWCVDDYSEYSNKSQTNPLIISNGACHVLRGGSVKSDGVICRVSSRNAALSDRVGLFGIRLVLR